jgi:hypothetical protein
MGENRMKSEKQTHYFFNPLVYFVFSPFLLVLWYLWTHSIIGAFYIHFWLFTAITSVVLMMEKQFEKTRNIWIVLQLVLWISLFELFLYVRILI